MQREELSVRPALDADVDPVVNLHLSTFQGFFLSFLGRGFIKLLYQSIRAAPEGVVLVATVKSRPVGFVAGVTSQREYYRRLVRTQWWRFARSALGAAIRKPSITPRLVRALRRTSESEQSAADAALMSIGVDPEYEGKGVGSTLIEVFCRELANRGATDVCLTTDRDNNDRAHRVYVKNGFRATRSFVTPEGRPMVEYVRALS